MQPALHRWRSSNLQRLIWILVLTRTQILLLPTGQTEEGKLLDLELDVCVTDTDQASTEEQNYRETMRGVRSYMGWTHIPDIDANTSSAEDNPFAALKQQPVGKMSLNLPTDDWLCRKMDGLNLTLV